MLLIHHCVFKNDYALSGKVFKGAPAPKVTQHPLAKFRRHKENNFVSAPVHNVHFVKNDVTVSFMAQVLDTVAYFVSHVLVVDTVTYFDIFR